MTDYANLLASIGAQANADVLALQQALAVCQAGGGGGTPPGMAVGVNAYQGATAALAKWGTVPLRVFDGGNPLGLFVLPAGGVVSFNPVPAHLLGGLYDAEILQWAAAQTHPCELAPWHELDNKANSGVVGIPTLAEQAQIVTHIAQLLAPYPHINVRIIVTAHLIVSPSVLGPLAAFMVPGVKRIGFDFDGSRPAALPYTDYTQHLLGVHAYTLAGYDVAVPEYGVPRVANDPTGQARAAWLLTYGHALRGAGATALYVFDTPPEGPLDPASPEFAAIKMLAAGK